VLGAYNHYVDDKCPVFLYTVHVHVCILYLLLTSVGPEFNVDCWLNEKFNLGLDFPNVGDTYLYIFTHSLVRCVIFC